LGVALASAEVQVDAVGAVQPAWQDAMMNALAAAGVTARTTRRAKPPPLRIALTRDYREPELREYARRQRAEGITWLPVKPCGSRPLIGPIFSAAPGPCWECLAHALERNRPVEQFLEREQPGARRVTPPLAELPAAVVAVCNLTAVLAARHLAASETTDVQPSALIELELESLQTTSHRVLERPQCPVCGDGTWMQRLGRDPVRLNHDLAVIESDGGYRTCTPSKTFERYRHLVSPLTGAITHVKPMPDRHTETRAVYSSGYLLCPRQFEGKTHVFDKACAGKGRTDEQARASALCEALERVSSVHQGDEARLSSTLRALGKSAIHPDSLQQFSERQFARRDELNRRTSDPRRRVPLPFDAGAPIDWIPAWSLESDACRYVPLAYCFAETPSASGRIFCDHNPNGTASGNCLEEAILHGFLELVERDAAAIWWYNELALPAVALSSFGDPFFDGMLAEYAALGFSLWVLSLTHDLGIPSFVAVAHRKGQNGFTLGFGCHLSAKHGILRALTELNQLFDPVEQRTSARHLEDLPAKPYLFPDPTQEPLTPDALPAFEHRTLFEAIAHCRRVVVNAELELLIVNKTRPDFGLSVAQVIVPGLRHFWPRFAPGRLYTVPERLGRLVRSNSEEMLNPVELLL
jgi:oxazoline/thiazoline synthase